MKYGFSTMERDLLEWGEYDASLLDVSEAVAAEGESTAAAAGDAELETSYLNSGETELSRRKCSGNHTRGIYRPVVAEIERYARADSDPQEQLGSPQHLDLEDHLVDPAAGVRARTTSFEFDPYAEIRPGLRPEHASLSSDRLAVIIGGRPAIVALHGMLSSGEPQKATLAVLLGRSGRRSARLYGCDVPISAYFRVLSRLCREAAEQVEGDRTVHKASPVNPLSELAGEHFGAHSEAGEIPPTRETLGPAEYPFVPEAFEQPVAFQGQVPPLAVKPDPRDITLDAFFEDEWASSPTAIVNPRHVHFNRFTTLTATTATAQTILTHKANPLDPRITPGLIQPEVIPASRPAAFGETYWVFVPDAYKKAVKDAVAAKKPKPVARVSLLFGVGAEVNRHGLRLFFANTLNCVLIEVGGIESVPEVPNPWGIGITDAMIDDLLNQALGTNVTSQVEVIAAYSTGYRGINGTINNALINLTHLKKMIFYDCLYRADGPKAPSGALMPPKRHREAPAKSAFNTWRAVHAVRGVSPTCEIIVYDVTLGGTPTYSDGARKGDVPGATFIALKPLNVHLKALILARLMDNGIKDGYFTDAKVPSSIRAFIPLLPTRGTLSSSSSPTASGTIGKWARDNSVKIAQSMKGFATAMELARIHKLMGWATPATEFGHDGFLPEFGWEHLAG
jgi:hypothetical protein